MDQCFAIKRFFNLHFRNDPIYGLGQASVIKKKRYLDPIKEKIHKPSNELYTIIVGDHSVSIFGNYIFNSQNTHAVYRSKSNFTYIF